MPAIGILPRLPGLASSIGLGGLPSINFGMQLRSGSVRNSGFARNFFDRKKVTDLLDRDTHRRFNRFGFLTMKDARQRIRNRKVRKRGPRKGTNVSLPGQSPTNQTSLLKNHIYYSYDAFRRSVIIGPAKLAGAIRGRDVPRKLEEGIGMAARPYMRPAFERQLNRQFPGRWGAIRN